MSVPKEHPKFTDLPLNPGDPPLSAWGLYGPQDERGTLNLLTPERTVEAAREIQSGVSVGLNWPLHHSIYPTTFRPETEHKIFKISPNMNDDTLKFNTQVGSQWDGLRHVAFNDGRFYNGMTQEEIHSGKTTRLGTQAWAKQGIVGRGVLIDYGSYAARNNITYQPLSNHPVSLSLFQQIASESGITFRAGDIIFLRMGFTNAWANVATTEEKKEIMARTSFMYPGLESTRAVLQFLWDTKIAAVAADSPGFECWPPCSSPPNAPDVTDGEGMHPILLAGFGMPIGEMFDLDDLAEECKRQNRWSFFVTSMPLNVFGGVGSPPNATAVF